MFRIRAKPPQVRVCSLRSFTDTSRNAEPKSQNLLFKLGGAGNKPIGTLPPKPKASGGPEQNLAKKSSGPRRHHGISASKSSSRSSSYVAQGQKRLPQSGPVSNQQKGSDSPQAPRGNGNIRTNQNPNKFNQNYGRLAQQNMSQDKGSRNQDKPGVNKATQKQKALVQTEEEKQYSKFLKHQEKIAHHKEASKDMDDDLHVKRPTIALPKFVSLANFANYLRMKLSVLQEKMVTLGFTETGYDNVIDGETAVLVSDELGFDAVINEEEGADLFPASLPEDTSSISLRPPIVTIMGHVDHGKTTILDYLRKSSVAAGEHGGITQHIGAFSVRLPSVKDNDRNQICFLDTPGHAAFLNMRQRGATVTDIVILVVAADDSVMPQTKEAIKHAQSAGVPIIVAVNKIDKEDANPDRVIADLAANGVDVEPYGGETQVILVSGKTGQGISELEEAILTLSEMMDIRSPSDGPAEGWVIESHMKKGLGNVATVLVRRGTLKTGSAIVAGTKWCKIRMLIDDRGKSIKSAGPATPVEVLGWKDLPEAGDEVLQAQTESYAKQVVANRVRREQQLNEGKAIAEINEKRRQMRIEQQREELRQERLKLGLSVDEEVINEALGETSQVDNGPKKLNFVIKSDVSGSAEAVQESIQGLGNNQIQANVLYSGVGPVSESDLNFAETSGASILTFNINTPRDVSNKASQKKIPIIEHKVIYRLMEDVTKKLAEQLPPEIHQKVLAEASVRQVFEITMKKSKNLVIAGCRVTNGAMQRNAKVKVLRDKKIIYTGTFTTMKHHKEEVSEAKKDSECGLAFEGWDKFEEGDVVQSYEEVIVPRHL